MLESVSLSAEVTLPQVPCSTTLSSPTPPPLLLSSPTTSTPSSTSPVILPPAITLSSGIDHALGKARSHFTNRPNVQNGLTSSSFKNGPAHPFTLQHRNNNPNPSSTQPNSSSSNNNNNNNNTSPISLPPASASAHLHHPDFGRPPFITTVTRGRFLPSKFDLLVEKHLYTFSSRPRPLGLVSKHQCSLYGSAPGNRTGPQQRPDQTSTTPRGIHDYYNLMWDPHIRRGNPSGGKLIQPEEIVQDKKGRILQGSEGRTKRSTTTIANAPPSTSVIHAKKKQVRIGTPPPVKGRFHNTVQTEVFLEDLTQSSHIVEVDKVVQTDFIHPDVLPPLPVTLKTGVDASTEILPGELVDFDEQVQPLVSTLVAKVLEQAFLETMEEEELTALREQQNRFQEKKKEEERQLRLLQEQHNKINAEKEMLKKHLTERRIIGEESVTGSSNTNGPVYSTSYLLELLPSVLNSLRQEGFLSDALGNELFPHNSSTHPPEDVKLGGNGSSEEIQENQDSPDARKERADTSEDSKRESDEPWSALANLEKELIQSDSLES